MVDRKIRHTVHLITVAGDADRGLDKVKLNASEKLRHCSETLSRKLSRSCVRARGDHAPDIAGGIKDHRTASRRS